MKLFSDEYFMKEALKEAELALSKDEVPVGAVIVSNNQVIARAHNLTETLNDATAHAEIQAITAASIFLNSKYLTDCTLYITLEPCLMCAGATNWAKLGKIVYGASDEKRGFSLVNSSVLHPKTILKRGVLEDESTGLLTKFFKNKR